MYWSTAEGANVSRQFARLFLFALLISSHPLMAQRTVTVALTALPGGAGFRFVPDRVSLRPGDVLEFSVTSGGPYVVAFEPAGLDPRVRSQLATAMQDRTGELRSPVLSGSGARFRLALPALPRGSYRFIALTHVAYRMAGVLTVP